MEQIYEMFKTRVRALGNSNGMIIPKHIVEDWGLERGDQIVLKIVRKEKENPSAGLLGFLSPDLAGVPA